MKTKRKLIFCNTQKSNLPEVQAYKEYFEKNNFFKAIDFSNEISISEIDVIWEFKGIGRKYKKKPGQLLIHEYASLSVGRFPKIKNYIKIYFNRKPDLRIFLNKDVKNEMKFKDNVPYILRDMGVDESFYEIEKYRNSEFDFIYVGNVDYERKIHLLLNAFIKKKNYTIILVGQYNDKIYSRYNKFDNITFVGKVPYKEVPIYLSKAKNAINFIPNKYPYNIQTSTKLQEYAAAGLSIISTRGKWVEEFEANNGCKFFYIDENNVVLPETTEISNLVTNISDEYLWDRLLDKSGLNEKLLKLVEML